MSTTLNQKRNSSFLSFSLTFFSLLSLLLITFFVANRHYQQNTNELTDYKPPEEIFEPLPDDELPPSKEPVKKEKLEPLNPRETSERLEAQRKWKNTVFPKLYSNETKEEISKFLNIFYKKFLNVGLNSRERKWRRETKSKYIRPKKVDGRDTTKKTLNKDIERCKIIFPKIKEANIYWDSFGGWLSEKEKGEKEKDDTVLMGLCVNDVRDPTTKEKKGGSWYSRNPWKGSIETLCYWTYRRISIKLKPELFFFRYNSWVTIDKNSMKTQQLRIGWKQLIETIAHELAHAVINTILIDDKVAKLVEGHGGLHDDFTEKIKKMIEKSSEYTDFKIYMEDLDK